MGMFENIQIYISCTYYLQTK